jgi:hypothetical protein
MSVAEVIIQRKDPVLMVHSESVVLIIKITESRDIYSIPTHKLVFRCVYTAERKRRGAETAYPVRVKTCSCNSKVEITH